MSDVPPRRIGPYELEGLLGEGGIGQVFAARDTLLGRRVAIKRLRPELSLNRSLMDRFYVEAKSLANLNHPNITTLHALQLDGNEAFMVIELVRGQALDVLLSRTGCLPLRESRAVLAQVIAGLSYAHRMGVIHRDIKPSNLMVTDAGVLKIMDFGLARVNGSQQITRTGEFQGTLAYASPEQIRGDVVDQRSDLYSLAIVFYKLLVGAAPFVGDSDYALMTAHLQEPPPPLAGRVPLLDASTEWALMRALEKRPESRFDSVEEFGRAVGAASIRGEAVDILHQLFVEVFRGEASDVTRIIPVRARLDVALPGPSPHYQPAGPLLAEPEPAELLVASPADRRNRLPPAFDSDGGGAVIPAPSVDAVGALSAKQASSQGAPGADRFRYFPSFEYRVAGQQELELGMPEWGGRAEPR